MAQKLAVVTLVTNPEWEELAKVTLPSQRHYADRLGADFVVMDRRIYPHPQYDKWQVIDLFPRYDRLIFLDADMIVRPDCPDLFVIVPPEHVGGENELLSYPDQGQHLELFCRRLGTPPLPCPYYLNSGVFVASACHRQLFREPEVVFTDLPWPEQTHMNVRLIGEHYSVCLLPPAFNDRHRQVGYLRQSYILHYSCMYNSQRIEAAQRDLAGWSQLFRREDTPVSLPPPPQAMPAPASIPADNGDRDYVSPGLLRIDADRFFPNMTVGNKSNCDWPHFRGQIPHKWYVDRRAPTHGFLNRDEVHILFNTALRFRGQRALEIGCWVGWTTCHLGLAGVLLDTVDPILERQDFHYTVASSLGAAGVLDAVNLVAGHTPQAIHDLASQRNGTWSLFVINSRPEAPHPVEDARACEVHAADDALILLPNLVSPDVVQALDYLKERGWQTRIYQTVQIIGVAWRGNVKPVEHVPDPSVVWTLPDHLLTT